MKRNSSSRTRSGASAVKRQKAAITVAKPSQPIAIRRSSRRNAQSTKEATTPIPVTNTPPLTSSPADSPSPVPSPIQSPIQSPIKSPILSPIQLPVSAKPVLSHARPTSSRLLPSWLSSGLELLHSRFPDAIFEGLIASDGAPRVRCTDCPGVLYIVADGSVSQFELHLRNRKHGERLRRRLGTREVGRTERVRHVERRVSMPAGGKMEGSTIIVGEEMKVGGEKMKTTVVYEEGKDGLIAELRGEVGGLQTELNQERILSSQYGVRLEAMENKVGGLQEKLDAQAELLHRLIGMKEMDHDMTGMDPETPSHGEGPDNGSMGEGAVRRPLDTVSNSRVGLGSFFKIFGSS